MKGRIEPSFCPTCGQLLDAWTGPNAGDITVCLYCGESMRYNEQLGLEKLTDRQAADLPREVFAELTRIRGIVRRMRVPRPNVVWQ